VHVVDAAQQLSQILGQCAEVDAALEAAETALAADRDAEDFYQRA
jgi:hypothetical protein